MPISKSPCLSVHSIAVAHRRKRQFQRPRADGTYISDHFGALLGGVDSGVVVGVLVGVWLGAGEKGERERDF